MRFKHILFWLPMIAIAFGNAAIRELIFTGHMSELNAHQISTLTLIAFCSVYVCLIYNRLQIHGYKPALIIGFSWVILTVAFEFSMGRLSGKPWSFLLLDYNIAAGHIWPVFLICLFLLPYLCGFVKK